MYGVHVSMEYLKHGTEAAQTGLSRTVFDRHQVRYPALVVESAENKSPCTLLFQHSTGQSNVFVICSSILPLPGCRW